MKKRIHRRDILRFGTAGLLIGGTSALFPRVAGAQPSVSGGPLSLPTKLCVFFLRGGMDGINMIAPDGDGEYDATLRPTLYLPNTDPGDGFYSRSLAASSGGNTFARAHPGLASLVESPGNPYSNDDVLFMHLMGYQDQSRSHFTGQQNWETTRHNVPSFTHGWLTRLGEVLGFHLINTPTYNPVGGVSVSPTLQMMMSGSPAMVHCPSIAQYTKDPNGNPYYDTLYARLKQTYEETPSGHTWDQLTRETGLATVDSLAEIETLPAYVPATNWTGLTPGHVFPSTEQELIDLDLPTDNSAFALMAAGRDATQLLKETSARVVCLQDASYDTHGNEKYPFHDRMKLIAHFLRSLQEEIQNDPSVGDLWQRTVVMVISEFGRTADENGSKGTDHGKAGVITVMGGSVNGGVRNCDGVVWGDSQGTMFTDGVGTSRYPLHVEDYRTVYAEIARKWFGIRNVSGGTQYLDYVVDGYSTLGLPGFPYLGILP